MSEITRKTNQDARNRARDVLIGYLCQPPFETDEALREAVTAYADEMGTSYEEALRVLLTGTRSA